ncbi:MAG: hypothetical protein ACI35P_04750 [Bacillus sp. (in: firmicutes)]
MKPLADVLQVYLAAHFESSITKKKYIYFAKVKEFSHDTSKVVRYRENIVQYANTYKNKQTEGERRWRGKPLLWQEGQG